MKIETKELKTLLVELSDEYRSRTAGLRSVPPIHVGAIQIITTLLLWLDKFEKQESDMETLKSNLKVKLVTLDEIPQRTRKSELNDELINKVADLIKLSAELKQQGSSKVAALAVEDGMSYVHLATKIGRLRKQKRIPDTIKLIKRGDACLLVNPDKS